jgi:hypothetical protein
MSSAFILDQYSFSPSVHVMSAPSANNPATSEKGFPYLALFDCDADEEEELEFIAGDIILVLHKEDDAWWYGKNQRTGQEGTLPYNYVEKCDADAPSPFDSPNTQRRLAAAARSAAHSAAPAPLSSTIVSSDPSASLPPSQIKSVSAPSLPPALPPLPPPMNSSDSSLPLPISSSGSKSSPSTPPIQDPLLSVSDEDKKIISSIIANPKQKIPHKFSCDLVVVAASAGPCPALPARGYPRKSRAATNSPATLSDTSVAITPDRMPSEPSIIATSSPSSGGGISGFSEYFNMSHKN